MKVIDLLDKIANGEEFPKKVKYEGTIYEYIKYDYQNYEDYQTTNLFSEVIYYNKQYLNEEIEIIEDTPKEDKKIEKLKYVFDITNPTYNENWLMCCIEDNKNKINEIIDKLNGE